MSLSLIPSILLSYHKTFTNYNCGSTVRSFKITLKCNLLFHVELRIKLLTSCFQIMMTKAMLPILLLALLLASSVKANTSEEDACLGAAKE